ncbi:noncanonical pyrimidine nucleotidase, YjjG family [Leuconostoc carnosum]|uniref:YjjG family noncanonical pyrimidine nucleotidase n=1 Tax=Leuconostoc TaxID=1243 RepID=UPI000D520827|nr:MULTISPECIES: YjjG family noncanonical pyrimidine nucleotidase [Leuconostoc]KAA8325302.1 noncanonical pyrimidine nucleotidase, YjjG family [Leuconostoc carnosum]KAA8359526.1 noncanonical pyrimidine nucleotidase, YjjG family [Leuconostoc carnosum]KAA8365100.1 noncanonical pyrimidine nucleotidase, YjjG family [Leuconostoc carnosum]KAA8367470.1 noncanonical pyrimidine nucleotidase, YjjG family [Leuconostoc carnosum]KAA8372663.1 noncanonical pyrimidine nucleotidase, YjjG family [Leuconostoc car
MIKNIIFDLDDTLLDFKRGEYEGVREILKKQGAIDLDRAFTNYNEINDSIWQKIEKGYDRQPLLDNRFSDTLALMGISTDGRELEKEYRKKLDQNYYVIPGAIALLKELTELGFTLFVGTNGVANTQHSRLLGSGINQYFDMIFISEEIGFRKPDPKFFSFIINTNPEINVDNTLMIGDRLSADIQGASSIAMKNIWFNPNNEPRKEDIKPTYTAGSYDDILHFLRGFS